MTKTIIERISITIPKTLLDSIDAYVGLQKTVDPEKSRSEVICDLIKRYIPSSV